MSPLTSLGSHVREELARTESEPGAAASARQVARLQAHAAALASRPSGTSTRGGKVRMLAVSFAVACAAAFPVFYALRVPPSHRAPLSFAVDALAQADVSEANGRGYVAAHGKDASVRFSDGSEVVLARDARARIESTTADGARVVVERGTTHARIVHKATTQWHFVAGPFDVEVTGTAFDLTWDAAHETATVAMAEGSVVVRGCGAEEGKRLVRGEVLRAQCTNRPVYDVASNMAAAPSPTPTPFAEGVPTTLASGEPMHVLMAPLPHRATNATTVASANVNVTPTAPADPAAIAAALWNDGNAARERGDLAETKRLRAELRSRFPRDARATVAAFELGQMAFDADHDYSAAERWFASYLREAPSGSLAREALGRSMESRVRSGNRVGARELAARYIEEFSAGPHASLAKKLMGEGE